MFRAYLPQIITALFGGLFVWLGIITFGNPTLFDKLFAGVLIFTAVVCRRDINIVSIIIILLFQLSWETLVWNYQNNHYLIKILLYLVTLWAIRYFWYDRIVRVTFFCTFLVVSAEIFWFVTNYSAPNIYWHAWLILSSIFVRFLLFSRVALIDHYFPEKGASINLDWIIYKLTAFVIIFQTLAIIEYLIRHILGYSNILIIHNSYSYVIQGIGTFSIWATFNEAYKQLIHRILKA